MKAEIIAVGSELLTPVNIDTNSLFLTERLNETGFDVHLKTIVGDDLEQIAAVLRSALHRSKLILLTGGLGPTEDDLTRAAVAFGLGRKISVDPDLLDDLHAKFRTRGYKMAKINERQAELIEGATVLHNPIGTAPGMWIEQEGVQIALLPGPPRELKAIFESAVLPRVRSLSPGILLLKRSLHISGMTESEVDSRVAPIYTTYPEVRTTILSSTAGIALHFVKSAEMGDAASDLEDLVAKIRGTLGDAVYTTSGESLEEVVGGLLRSSGRTLAVAESCSSGLLGARITRVPGSSDYFLGGVLCYSNEIKTRICGVPAEILNQHGAVSAEAAEALARGVRILVGSSVAVSITGIAGPGGGTVEKPVGLVYFGFADEKHTLSKSRILPGDRETVRERTAYLALSLLRRFLISGGVSG